jgi:YegS/Rv2252/BmrU family lipid kinase
MKVCFIVNPHSAAGATRKRFAELEPGLEKIFPDMTVRLTKAPCHATEIARQAVEDGFDAVVCCGGDGTLNETVVGLHQSGRPDAVLLGMIPSGTGGDFRKTSGFPKEPADTLKYLADFRERRVDYGNLEFLTLDGKPASRAFINIASIGVSGICDEFVNNTSKALGGKISFLISSFRGMMAYDNVDMTVKVDGQTIYEGLTNLVAMANGRFFGGGMMMAPDAELDDGMLRVVILTDLSKLGFMMLGSKIYSGQHVKDKHCILGRGKVVEIETRGRALIDLDGEMPGMGPLKATVIPSGIRLMVPSSL